MFPIIIVYWTSFYSISNRSMQKRSFWLSSTKLDESLKTARKAWEFLAKVNWKENFLSSFLISQHFILKAIYFRRWAGVAWCDKRRNHNDKFHAIWFPNWLLYCFEFEKKSRAGRRKLFVELFFFQELRSLFSSINTTNAWVLKVHDFFPKSQIIADNLSSYRIPHILKIIKFHWVFKRITTWFE